MLGAIAYHFDLFKKPLFLKHNKNSRISTCLGFAISFGVFLAVGLSLFQSNMVSKTNPNVIEKTVVSLISPEQILGKETSFIFALTDKNRNTFIDDSIFKVEAWMHKLDGGSHYFSPLPMVNCEKQFFSGFEAFTSANVSCLLNPQAKITGNQNEGNFWSLTFTLRVCNNQTDNITCKSEDEILDFLKDKMLVNYFPDYSYNIDDFQAPYNLKFKFQIFSELLTKSIWTGIYMKESHFKSDDNFIFSQEDEIILSLFDVKEQIVFPIASPDKVKYMNNPSSPLLMIYFQSSNNIHSISRRYQKLQEALANMSGVANTLITLGMLLTALDSKITILSMIIKNLYSFRQKKKISNKEKETEKNSELEDYQDNEDTKRNLKQINLKCIEKVFLKQELPLNLETNPNEINIEITEQTKDGGQIEPKCLNDEIPLQESLKFNKKEQSKIDELQKEHAKIRKFDNFLQRMKKPKNVKFTSKDFILTKIKQKFRKKLTDDQKIILKAEEASENEIDIIKILQKLHDIDKLKFILLSPSQLSLFNFLAKPILDIEEDDPKKGNSMV